MIFPTFSEIAHGRIFEHNDIMGLGESNDIINDEDWAVRKEQGIKDKLDNDLNHNQVMFTYLTNPNLSASDNWIDNHLTSNKISPSWDMLINLKYFKLV